MAIYDQLALSTIHDTMLTLKFLQGENIGAETLVQYNKALRQLRSHLGSEDRPSAKVALICCVLFCQFETMRGEITPAFEHLRNGIDILCEHKSPNDLSDTETQRDDLDELKYVFHRMELQAMQFNNIKFAEYGHLRLQLISADERAGNASCVPRMRFENLDEAHWSLDKLQSWFFAFFAENDIYKFLPLEELPTAVREEKDRLLTQYDMWQTTLLESTFQDIAEGSRDRTPEVVKDGVIILRLLHRMQQLLLRAILPLQEEAIFDVTPNPDIESVLDWAAHLVASPNVSPGSFSSETGIVAPLGIIVLKCHDPEICARAMAILAAAKRKESFIDSQMLVDAVAQFAQIRARKELSEQIAYAGQRNAFWEPSFSES